LGILIAEKVINAINVCETNGSAEPSCAKTRRADALVSLADTGCEGYEITLHVPAETSQSTNTFEFESGSTLPMTAAERLCCDTKIIPVIEVYSRHSIPDRKSIKL